MKEFLGFYRWGMEVKLYMSIYTLALLTFKGIVAVAQGEFAISVWVMLEMLALSFAVAIVQYALFPMGESLTREQLVRRSAVWALCGNVAFIGGAVAFDWFAGVPAWAAAGLVVVLEVGLYAMWFGDHVARRRDTRTLNEKLRDYQQE